MVAIYSAIAGALKDHLTASCLQSEELPVAQVPDVSVKPTLVRGAKQDALVDEVDCSTVADRFQTQAVVLDGSGHDAMLDSIWQRYAERIRDFVVSL